LAIVFLVGTIMLMVIVPNRGLNVLKRNR